MDRNTMAEIYDRWKNTVYRAAYAYCRSIHDAEDITQEVFLTRFSADMVFASDEAEKAWLIRVAVNKCKNMLRRFDRSRTDSLDSAKELCETPQENEVMEAVNELPDKYRILIYLHYIEGYNLREIAELTAQTETNVQTKLYRARKQLKKTLKEDF